MDRLGINRFSLYATFGSKGRLFLRALDRYRDGVATQERGPRRLAGNLPASPAIRA
ncbi:MAG: hypothetical protein HY704_06720 [Gemmatimonadetes bacterium]|nr:hypothetical protein [Gemmatimonadota bacterium]